MKEMLMWDKYDNKYRTVVDVEELKELKQTASNDWKERCRLTFELQDLEKQLAEKDILINEMIEEMVGLTVWDSEKGEPLILKDKQEVIDYFKKKCKEKR